MGIERITRRYGETPKQWEGIKRNEITIVLCPANMPEKWLDETSSTVSDSFARVVETVEDVHQFMDDFDAELNKGKSPKAVMIFTYERAKLGEATMPAYQIYHGKDGYDRIWNHELGKYEWSHRKLCIDPVTGGLLRARVGRRFQEVDEKKINNTGKLLWYEGPVFKEHEVTEEPITDRYGRVINPDEVRIETKPVTFRAVRDETTYESDKHYPLPMWQFCRRWGIPKRGNGIVDIEWEEVEVKQHPKFGRRIPKYAEDRETGKLKFVRWIEFERKTFTIERAKVKKVLATWRNTEDQWLAMQGIYCLTYSNKRKKINNLLRKHKLESYRLGDGIKELDKELKKLDATHYTKDKGKTTYRNPRFPLVDYIKHHYKDRIGLLIIDEIHRSKGADTDQGVYTRRLSEIAKMTIGLTGTLYGGYASSLYPIAHQNSDWVKENYEWVRATPFHWIRDMGAIENVYVESSYDQSGRYTGQQRYPRTQNKEIASASPKLLKVMLPWTIFGGLKDLGNAMPKYREIPIEIEMSEIQRGIYNAVTNQLDDYLKKRITSGDHSFTAAYYSTLLRLPDSMFRDNEVWHRRAKDPSARKKEMEEHLVMTTPSIGDMLTPKDEKMIELVKEYLSNNERVIIFMSQTNKLDIRPRIEKIIRENVPQANPFILPTQVKPAVRGGWITEKVEEGHNVMISNPKLVAEGVDLIEFNRTIYLEVDHSLQVMSQSSRRTWRLNQPKEECSVVYLYYDDKYQNKAVRSVADKNRAANTLYGNDEAGIAELAQTNEFFSKMNQMANEAGKLSQEEMEEAFAVAEFTDADYLNSSWYSENMRKDYDFGSKLMEELRVAREIDQQVDEVMDEWLS